jgi:hypothetical protein
MWKVWLVYNMATYLQWQPTRLQQSSGTSLAAHKRYSKSEYQPTRFQLHTHISCVRDSLFVSAWYKQHKLTVN